MERDHPRGCGEHYRLRKYSLLNGGSSPRMRGTLIPRQATIQDLRIVPADAGNTSAFLLRFFSTWDHPRGCGEHNAQAARDSGASGSSPRMRGTLHVNPVLNPGQRIIPADAGNTR